MGRATVTRSNNKGNENTGLEIDLHVIEQYRCHMLIFCSLGVQHALKVLQSQNKINLFGGKS